MGVSTQADRTALSLCSSHCFPLHLGLWNQGFPLGSLNLGSPLGVFTWRDHLGPAEVSLQGATALKGPGVLGAQTQAYHRQTDSVVLKIRLRSGQMEGMEEGKEGLE